MSPFALSLVLGAAFLHALWNALVKANEDRAMVLAGVAGTHGLIGLVMVLAFAPPGWEAAPYVLASVILHFGYYATLFQCYRFADLSLAYPISRGLAPLVVSAGAFLFAGERLSPPAVAGVAAISLGIMLLATGRRSAPRSEWAVPAAILLGLIIASYTVVDGIGVRLAENPFGYIGWLFLGEALVTVYVIGRRRGRLAGAPWRSFRAGCVAGVLAGAAYGTVIFAKTIAPLGMVSAVRESSVIIAAAIGVIWFGERPWGRRVVSAGIVACGVITLSAFG